MAVAKSLLRRRELGMAEVAERVGEPPGRYARSGIAGG